MYLAKTMTFGDMMQTRTSFARVQDSFGWFTDSYRRPSNGRQSSNASPVFRRPWNK